MENLGIEILGTLGTSVAHAQGAAAGTFVPISEGFNNIIGLAGSNAQFGGGDFGQVVNGIYKLSIRIAGAVAVAMFVYGGIMYMTQPFGISEGGVGKAKEKMQNAVLGLLMLLATWVIFNQINPDILSLKVNAKPLEALKSSTQTSVQGTAPTNSSIAPGAVEVRNNDGSVGSTGLQDGTAAAP